MRLPSLRFRWCGLLWRLRRPQMSEPIFARQLHGCSWWAYFARINVIATSACRVVGILGSCRFRYEAHGNPKPLKEQLRVDVRPVSTCGEVHCVPRCCNDLPPLHAFAGRNVHLIDETNGGSQLCTVLDGHEEVATHLTSEGDRAGTRCTNNLAGRGVVLQATVSWRVRTCGRTKWVDDRCVDRRFVRNGDDLIDRRSGDRWGWTPKGRARESNARNDDERNKKNPHRSTSAIRNSSGGSSLSMSNRSAVA